MQQQFLQLHQFQQYLQLQQPPQQQQRPPQQQRGQQRGGRQQQQQQPQQSAGQRQAPPNVPDPSQRTARPSDNRSYAQAAASVPATAAPSGPVGQGVAAPAGNAAPAAAPAGDAATGTHPVERDAARTAALRQRLLETRAALAAYLKGNSNPQEAVVNTLQADIDAAKQELDNSKPLADLLNLEKKILKQREADFEKKEEAATAAWALVPKAVEAARQKDALRKEAQLARDESRARIAELSEAAGQPPPPSQLQSAVAAAEQLRQQLLALPAQDTDAVGGVTNLLAVLQATVSAAAGDAPMGDGQRPEDGPPQQADNQPDGTGQSNVATVESVGVADPAGNAAPASTTTARDDQSRAAPAEPSGVVDPAGNTAPATAAATEAPATAPDGDQQAASISATQEETELIAQANALSRAVQYEAPQLAEARAALGARLTFPPLDFDSIRSGVQQVHQAIAKQAEANDVPPQTKVQR